MRIKKLLTIMVLTCFAFTASNVYAYRNAEKMERVIKKSTQIIKEFKQEISSTKLDNCMGIAVLSISKAGFVLSARGGSGIVIAKQGDKWSAPSYIKSGGLGIGFQIGAQVTDFVLILNTQEGLDAFTAGKNVTLGGNLSVSAGDIGKTAEADVAPTTAIFSYSKSKGIFAGVSLEGAVLIEGKSENSAFYGKNISAHQLLKEEIELPEIVNKLHDAL